jgi:hypothetical protein
MQVNSVLISGEAVMWRAKLGGNCIQMGQNQSHCQLKIYCIVIGQ